MVRFEPAHDSLKIETIHRGAAGCRRRRVFPNVKEDARAVSFDHRIRVISDENAELVRRSDLKHFFRAFPIEDADLITTNDFIVMMRIYIVDANNTPGQFLTSGTLNAWRLEQLARAFVDHFPSRRTTCLSILA